MFRIITLVCALIIQVRGSNQPPFDVDGSSFIDALYDHSSDGIFKLLNEYKNAPLEDGPVINIDDDPKEQPYEINGYDIDEFPASSCKNGKYLYDSDPPTVETDNNNNESRNSHVGKQSQRDNRPTEPKRINISFAPDDESSDKKPDIEEADVRDEATPSTEADPVTNDDYPNERPNLHRPNHRTNTKDDDNGIINNINISTNIKCDVVNNVINNGVTYKEQVNARNDISNSNTTSTKRLGDKTSTFKSSIKNHITSNVNNEKPHVVPAYIQH